MAGTLSLFVAHYPATLDRPCIHSGSTHPTSPYSGHSELLGHSAPPYENIVSCAQGYMHSLQQLPEALLPERVTHCEVLACTSHERAA